MPLRRASMRFASECGSPVVIAYSSTRYGFTASAPRASATITSCRLRRLPAETTSAQSRRNEPAPPGCARSARCAAATTSTGSSHARPSAITARSCTTTTRAQQAAGRQVLDLALAVDRRIRDPRSGLVEVVCEVRRRGERGERSVVAERADRLVPGLGHVGGVLQVVGLEPEGRELPLPADRDVLHLVGRDADLPAPAGVHRLGGAAAGDALAEPVEHHPAGAPGGEEPRADGVLIDEAPAAVAPQRDVLAGAKRIRIGDVALERDESALAREYVLVLGLDVPERAKAERVDAKDAGVTDAREDRRGSLRERTERGARLHVHVLQLAAHPLHLIHDRREEGRDRFYGGGAGSRGEGPGHPTHPPPIPARPRQNKPP